MLATDWEGAIGAKDDVELVEWHDVDFINSDDCNVKSYSKIIGTIRAAMLGKL